MPNSAITWHTPFTALMLVHRAAAKASFPDDAEWGYFLERAGQIGSAVALKAHGQKSRRRFRKRLAELAFALPSHDWAHRLEVAVARIAPS